MAQENYLEALSNLEQAKFIAEREGFLNELRRIHCLIGVVKGTMEFSNFTRHAGPTLSQHYLMSQELFDA
jgi:hypothetical protein